MRKIIFLFIFILFAVTVIGQTPTRDVVRLKNGWVLKGTVLYSEGKKIKIVLEGGSILTFDKEEVISIGVENAPPPQVYYLNKPKEELKIKTRGFFNITEIGMNMGQANSFNYDPRSGQPGNYSYMAYSFSLHSSINYFIHRFSVGAGMGIESFNRQGYMPFYAIGQYHFFLHNDKASFTPYLKLGANLPLGSNRFTSSVQQPGFLGDAGAALNIYFSNSTAFRVGLGYRFQHIKAERVVSYWDNQGFMHEDRFKEEIYFNRIALKLGFIF